MNIDNEELDILIKYHIDACKLLTKLSEKDKIWKQKLKYHKQKLLDIKKYRD